MTYFSMKMTDTMNNKPSESINLRENLSAKNKEIQKKEAELKKLADDFNQNQKTLSKEEIQKTQEEFKKKQKELKKLKNEKEDLESQIEDKVSKEDVKKLLDLLSKEGDDKEITINALMDHFDDRKAELKDIIQGEKLEDAAFWARAYEKASDEEKKEIALLYQNFQIELGTNAVEKTEAEKAVIAEIKKDLSVLNSEIVSYKRYNVEKTFDATSDQAKDTKSEGSNEIDDETIDLIYKQLASKDKDMKVKLSSEEEKMMKGFIDLINDLAKNEGTKTD